MTLKFIHPTTAQVMRVASVTLAIVNTVLTIGATITNVPAAFAWLTAYWPTVYGVALVMHQLASTCGITPDGVVQGQLAAHVEEARALLAAFEAAKNGTPKA